MSTSAIRRRSRRPASREAASFKKDSQHTPPFFGQEAHEPFFKQSATMPQANVQRKCLQSSGTHGTNCEGEEKVQRTPEKKEEEKVQRTADKKEEERVQKREAATAATAPANTAGNYISSIHGKGQALSPNLQSFYGNRIGADFSNVKIHTGQEAAESAKDINAQAYAYGSHIVFGEGKYQPNTSEGKHLLAHELTHVVQQTGKNETGTAKKVLRSVSVQSPYSKTDDFEPSVQFQKQSPALGYTDAMLNGVSQSPVLGPGVFETALNKPVFSERDLDAIQRPNLADASLDPVRANWLELAKGSTHVRAVKLVQEALVAWGRGMEDPVELLPVYGADGNFKKETKGAVEFFQSKHPGLTVDGVVGDHTLAALQKEMDQLHGKIYKLEAVGNNVFTGLIHTPPSPAQWRNVNTTPKAFDSNTSVMQVHRDMVAIHLLKNCKNVSNLLVIYKSNGDVPASILKHEQVHEKDQLATINRHVDPWDVKLQIAKLLNFKTKAGNEKEAAAILYKNLGIPTPEKLAKNVVAEWQAGNVKFHNSPAGSAVKTGLDTPDCTRVILTFSP
jgi:peptidoglycan hydrolase-like protein with peptidoglycan-binding domain